MTLILDSIRMQKRLPKVLQNTGMYQPTKDRVSFKALSLISSDNSEGTLHPPTYNLLIVPMCLNPAVHDAYTIF